MSAKKAADSGRWFIWLMTGFQALIVLGFFLGLWLLLQDFQFYRRAITTQAEIVDIEYSQAQSGVRGTTGSLNIYPVFSFIDQNSGKQSVKPIVAMQGPFSIGENREIMFDPANPSKRVQLVGWQFYTGIGGILLLVTAPIAALFIWGQVRQKSRKNQQRRARNQKARERRARQKPEKQN